MKRILILTLAMLLLSGCASFKLGGVCYLPHGMAGECKIAPVAAINSQRPASAPQ